MQNPNSLKYNLSKALFISIIAAVIIEIIFLILALGIISYTGLFTLPYVFILFLLTGLAMLAYKFFINGLNHSRRIAKRLIPLGDLLALAGLIINLLGIIYGIFLLILAYYIELITGYFMKRDFILYDYKGTRIFLIGLFIFVLSLPLILYNIYLILIPALGNLMKGIGLIWNL